MDHEELTLLRHWAQCVAVGQTHDAWVWSGRQWLPIAPLVRRLLAEVDQVAGQQPLARSLPS